MDRIKEADQRVYENVVRRDRSVWANFRAERDRYNILRSNKAESYNAWVGVDQHKYEVLYLI